VVVLAGQAVRGVALGVIGTALIQSSLAGLGLLVSGVPYPGIVTALVFVLCVAQMGPLLVMLPVCGWLYWSGDTAWAAGLLVWSVVVGLLDNVLRPLLIRKGADLPLLLIFAGVIGGLIAFGLIGLFIGPILLAVTYTLLVDWVSIEPPASAAPSQPDAGE
jgi:predicted PurR-regulated permease PerM